MCSVNVWELRGKQLPASACAQYTVACVGVQASRSSCRGGAPSAAPCRRCCATCPARRRCSARPAAGQRRRAPIHRPPMAQRLLWPAATQVRVWKGHLSARTPHRQQHMWTCSANLLCAALCRRTAAGVSGGAAQRGAGARVPPAPPAAGPRGRGAHRLHHYHGPHDVGPQPVHLLHARRPAPFPPGGRRRRRAAAREQTMLRPQSMQI
jgi:hypothetical protein